MLCTSCIQQICTVYFRLYCTLLLIMSHCMAKQTIWDSYQFRHKPGCTSTEDGFGFRKYRKCTIRVAKIKALISFAVTAKLICAFVFAYADCWFFHAAAQLSFIRCPQYQNLPSQCTLVKDPTNTCCSKPQCNFQTSGGATSGSGTMSGTMTGTGTSGNSSGKHVHEKYGCRTFRLKPFRLKTISSKGHFV